MTWLDREDLNTHGKADKLSQLMAIDNREIHDFYKRVSEEDKKRLSEEEKLCVLVGSVSVYEGVETNLYRFVGEAAKEFAHLISFGRFVGIRHYDHTQCTCVEDAIEHKAYWLAALDAVGAQQAIEDNNLVDCSSEINIIEDIVSVIERFGNEGILLDGKYGYELGTGIVANALYYKYKCMAVEDDLRLWCTDGTSYSISEYSMDTMTNSEYDFYPNIIVKEIFDMIDNTYNEDRRLERVFVSFLKRDNGDFGLVLMIRGTTREYLAELINDMWKSVKEVLEEIYKKLNGDRYKNPVTEFDEIMHKLCNVSFCVLDADSNESNAFMKLT